MTSTVCIRCGKQRILFKKWTEKSDRKGPSITYEVYVCPDSDCQRIVDQRFTEMREKRMESERRKSALHTRKT